jgi:hypothetical protein
MRSRSRRGDIDGFEFEEDDKREISRKRIQIQEGFAAARQDKRVWLVKMGYDEWRYSGLRRRMTASYAKNVTKLLGTARAKVTPIPAYSERTPPVRYISRNTPLKVDLTGGGGGVVVVGGGIRKACSV